MAPRLLRSTDIGAQQYPRRASPRRLLVLRSGSGVVLRWGTAVPSQSLAARLLGSTEIGYGASISYAKSGHDVVLGSGIAAPSRSMAPRLCVHAAQCPASS
eukprot:3918636-Rhodomonas_salina.2